MADNELNEVFTEEMVDANVITVPIDTTLTQEGEAADAAAVGAALALKADASSVVAISVNGEEPDNQGKILINGEDIPVSGSDSTTLKAAIAAVDGKTGEDIPISSAESAQTVKQAIDGVTGRTAEAILMATGSGTTIATKIREMDAATEQQREDMTELIAEKASIYFKLASFNSQNQANYDVESNTRHLIMILSNNENSQGIFVVNVSNNGNINALTVSKGSNITLNVATANKFRFIVGTVYTCRIYDILLGKDD